MCMICVWPTATATAATASISTDLTTTTTPTTAAATVKATNQPLLFPEKEWNCFVVVLFRQKNSRMLVKVNERDAVSSAQFYHVTSKRIALLNTDKTEKQEQKSQRKIKKREKKPNTVLCVKNGVFSYNCLFPSQYTTAYMCTCKLTTYGKPFSAIQIGGVCSPGPSNRSVCMCIYFHFSHGVQSADVVCVFFSLPH